MSYETLSLTQVGKKRFPKTLNRLCEFRTLFIQYTTKSTNPEYTKPIRLRLLDHQLETIPQVRERLQTPW